MKWLKSPKLWCRLAALALFFLAVRYVAILQYLLESPHLYQMVCGPEYVAVTAAIAILTYLLAICFFLFPPKYTPMIWVGTIITSYWLVFLSDAIYFLQNPKAYNYLCSRLYEFNGYFYSDVRSFLIFASGLSLCYYLPGSHRKQAFVWLGWAVALYLSLLSNGVNTCSY